MKQSHHLIAFFKNAREVICAERLLRSEGVNVEIIPVPEKYSSECGMCIRIPYNQKELFSETVQKEGYSPIVIEE